MFYRLFFVFYFLSLFSAFAVNTNPYSVVSDNQYKEGKLRHYTFENEKSVSYYIIPNWAGRSEFIYMWEGNEKDVTEGVKINYEFIHDIFQYKNDLIVAAQNKDSVYLLLATPDLKIQNNIFIKLKDNVKPLKIKELDFKGKKLLLIDNLLILLNIENGLTITNIDESTTDFDIYKEKIYYLSGLQGITSLKKYSSGISETLNLFDSFEMQKIFASDSSVAIIGSNGISNSSNCKIINTVNNDIEMNLWLESDFNLISAYKDHIFHITKTENYYTLYVYDELSGSTSEYNYPIELYEPIKLILDSNKVFTFFRNGLLKTDYEFNYDYLFYYPFGEYFQENFELTGSENKIIVSSNDFSQSFNVKKNELWKVKKYLILVYNYLTPILIIIVIVILIQLYRHQKRYVNEILEVPSIGLVLIVDKNGRLVLKNSKAVNVLNIPYNSARKKAVEFYLTNETYKPFLEMIQRSFKTRLDYEKRLNINDENNSKEWYCRSVILKNMTGQFRGLIFTALDITEQLERKRLSNWAQLAHDMQTNLSTIKLNAQQILADEDDINYERKNKIIHQVNVLFSRVRDIVTVGRSNKVDKVSVNASDICKSARDEFDSLMFPNVEFVLETEDFLINCDKNKLVRALRNSIENGIKALKDKNGTISISCKKDDKTANFSIKDTGIGMDENIRKKMLNPYFTTGGKTGGSGIGTMIMLHVVELHHGQLEINSKKGEGTEIIFKLPVGKTND